MPPPPGPLRPAAWCALLGLALAGAAGCRKFTAPPMVPVRGKVLHRNKPVGGMGVQFNPVDPRQKDNIGNGVTDAQGAFTLTTYYPQLKQQLQGAAVGRYKVVLVPYPGGDPVPPQYTDPEKTPWEVEVGPQGNEDVVLEVK